MSIMEIYTQVNKPDWVHQKDIWLPCLRSASVDHKEAPKQSLLITHIKAIEHYKYSLEPLFNEKVYCVGSKTYDKLNEMGFKSVEWRPRAEEIRIVSRNLGEITWLRGNKWARDFSHYQNVTTIQTYKTEPHKTNIKKVLKMSPDVLHVYSNQVLKEFEIRSWPTTHLNYVQSADPDRGLWKSLKIFDPNA
ncbi:uncharacterized protein METZ01_LOCUS96415 [marine metagenome]|uniref:Tetrapyrrole biosynthesis uroporphyrinogen III synthase domain-containing protein n=1 Tax=marine metagenome TaxID=408172 RepID=A0A381VU20_9ZZZZ